MLVPTSLISALAFPLLLGFGDEGFGVPVWQECAALFSVVEPADLVLLDEPDGVRPAHGDDKRFKAAPAKFDGIEYRIDAHTSIITRQSRVFGHLK